MSGTERGLGRRIRAEQEPDAGDVPRLIRDPLEALGVEVAARDAELGGGVPVLPQRLEVSRDRPRERVPVAVVDEEGLGGPGVALRAAHRFFLASIPSGVRRYRCLLLRGLSGIVISTSPDSRAGCR